MRYFVLVLSLIAGGQQGLAQGPHLVSGSLKLVSPDISADGKGHYEIRENGILAIRGKAKSWVLGRYKFNEAYQLKPEQVTSAYYRQLGKRIDFDNLSLTVTKVDKTSVWLAGATENGAIEMQFATGDELIDVLEIRFKGKYVPIRLYLKKG
ncbi:MAG: hypothetical protein HRU19_18365 [Pseudobacteriovorax sp.]|nr:hypothetical protein [Pseudobacteriovorax sp.]